MVILLTLVTLVSLISLVARMLARRGVTPMAEPALELAHKSSSHNRQQIAQSEVCGCFYCLAVFGPSEIKEWVDNDDTAVCPKCGIDSVLGSANGFSINEEFLRRMREYWFD
jgi:hypothetical protein